MDISIEDVFAKAEPTEITSSFDKRITIISDPQSVSCEQYNVICSKLLKLKKENGYSRICVTSSIKGEGKSLTTINIAFALVQNFGYKVCVVELDLKAPSLQSYLGTNKVSRLDELMVDRAKLMEGILKYCEGNLVVIPSGCHVPDHVKFLSSNAIETFLDELDEHFDFVILDTPPVLPLVDVRLIMEKADGLLFVVRGGETPRETVLDAINTLDSKKVIGVILNGVDNMNTYHYPYTYAKK